MAREFAGTVVRERDGRWDQQESQSLAGRGPSRRLFLYNPCSVLTKATARLEDVALALRADAILCPETRVGTANGDQCTVAWVSWLRYTSGGRQEPT